MTELGKVVTELGKVVTELGKVVTELGRFATERCSWAMASTEHLKDARWVLLQQRNEGTLPANARRFGKQGWTHLLGDPTRR